MQHGDEYFAELDYIETVEKYKEDYESEVLDDEDFDKEKSPLPEDDIKAQKSLSSKKR